MKNERKPSLAGVERAYAKVRAVVPETPLLPMALGDSKIWCKCESEQPMRAFKLRGAWHRLSDLSPEERARGVDRP